MTPSSRRDVTSVTVGRVKTTVDRADRPPFAGGLSSEPLETDIGPGHGGPVGKHHQRDSSMALVPPYAAAPCRPGRPMPASRRGRPDAATNAIPPAVRAGAARCVRGRRRCGASYGAHHARAGALPAAPVAVAADVVPGDHPDRGRAHQPVRGGRACLSSNTIAAHIRSIFRKLNVKSRVKLANAVRERDSG